MGFNDYLASLSRAVTWRVLLHLDYCEHTCGQSPCAAAGSPYCYYTYPTCRDPAHFSKGARTYAFCRTEGPAVADSLPYLDDLRAVPTEIRPREEVTRRARITLEFLDDAPLAAANPDKSVSNLETAGSFFRNLIARNPNAAGRIAEVWQGFAGLPLEEYRLVFRGVIEKLEWEEGRARVVVKDQLKLLDQKLPPKQSSDNVLTATYNGGATMTVSDGAEFEAPGTVKIESEYVTFTGVSADTLTGCAPGAYGTTPASHAAGKRVAQVAIFAETNGDGLPPDELFLALLCTHGGLPPLTIGVVDRGATLSAGVSSSSATLPVTQLEAFPETGIVRIEDEMIRYRGVVGDSLQVAERGAYGTAAAAHDQGAIVFITRFSDELGRWLAGTLFRRFVEQSVALKDLVNDLREQCLTHVWQAEDSTIAARCAAPPFYLETVKELTDETGFIAGSTAWDPGADLQVTRLTVHYDPLAPDPGQDPENYAGLLVMVDAEAESPFACGEVKNEEVWANWIYREHEALILASRYLIRFRSGAATFKFGLELKDDDLEVGDPVRLQSRDLIDATGAPRSALYEVIKKERVAENRLEFTALDTRLDRRYPVIAPTTMTADYDDAGETDREKFGWVGDSDNRVGENSEDGYYLY